jgi:TetR/AcrR family transcriptional regulator of autoinduction and epiphytic fitness
MSADGTPSTTRSTPDGRVVRGQRNRQRLVDTFLELVGAGHQRVTGAQLASAAGLSVRSLWTHFADFEALYEAASLDLWHRHVRAHVVVGTDQPLERRITQFCDQRRTELELLAPYARTAALAEPFSPALRASRQRFVSDLAREVDDVFGRELRAVPGGPGGPGGPVRRDALVAVAAYPCWSTWRDDLGLSATAARTALEQAVRGLLAG